MGKLKRWLAHRLIRYVSTESLNHELMRRGMDDAFGKLSKAMIETYYEESV